MRYLLLVCLLALAGCTQPADDMEDALPDAPTLAFGEPVLVAPGGDVEATVHVTDDGTILVCSHGGFHQPSPLWASEDGGATFERLDPQPNPVPSGDCDLTSGPDGEWAIVYDTIASATVAVSSDRGASWDLQYASALPIAVDRPWIHWHDDELYLTYANVMAAEPAVQMFARSTDGGQTFTEHNVIHTSDPPEDTHAVKGRMLAYGDTVRIPLARGDFLGGGPIGIDHAVSQDRGRTWTLEEIVPNYDPGGLVLPAAALAGEVIYQVVPSANGTLQDIAVMRSHDQGATWSEPQTVATGIDLPGVVGPWIDGLPDGRATLAWVEQVEAGWTVSALRVGPEGDVEGPVRLAEPSDEDQGIGHEFIMVDHTPDGRAVVAWPMDTGPDCDPDPNDVEDRGSQCVYVAIEDVAQGLGDRPATSPSP